MDTFVQRPFCSCAVSRRGRCTLTVCPRRGRALNETFRHFRSLLANNSFVASRSERGWARRVNVAHAASVLCRPAAVEWLVAMMAFPASPSATVAAMGGKRYRAGQGRLLVGGYGTVRRAGFEALWQSVGGVWGRRRSGWRFVYQSVRLPPQKRLTSRRIITSKTAPNVATRTAPSRPSPKGTPRA